MNYQWDKDGSFIGQMISCLPITYRRDNIKGVFNHEIGTHFLRKYNDVRQVWYKKRKLYKLKSYLATEEGLAALNQIHKLVQI